MGNVIYPEGIQFYSQIPTADSRDDTAYFNLNNAYNRLTGQIGTDDKSYFHRTVILSFIGDDKMLQKIPMVAADLPISIDLDVSGVHRLILDLVTDKNEGYGRNYIRKNIYIDLINMILWKSSESNSQLTYEPSPVQTPIVKAQPPEDNANEVNKPPITNEISKSWQKTFEEMGNTSGNSVQQTSDGGYVIAGTRDNGNIDQALVYLIKTDACGNKLWNKTFGRVGLSAGNSVQQTSDGGYIIAGSNTGLHI